MPHLSAWRPISNGFSPLVADADGRPRTHSWAQTAALHALRLYKVCFSGFFAGSCRFLPSCSDYAAAAIRQHGFWTGSRLAAWRLARCHPLARAGHDPVPPPSAPRRPASSL